ncbi:MAG: BON domain-containing protein [Gammaproteobacteria bacterium]|nr:BON domain-containing protein [Gammaproteobacteria bacterium]
MKSSIASTIGSARTLLCVVATVVLLQGCVAAVGAGAGAAAYTAYNRRSPGAVIDDQIIEVTAYNTLASDTELYEQSHVQVTSYNNVVLLTGEAPTETLRLRAESLVSGVDKVRRVFNELSVAAPSSYVTRSGDTWITAKVKTNLFGQMSLEASQVKVTTTNGIVYLMGLVTPAEAEQATEVARRVSGVQRVVKLFEYVDPAKT